MPQPLDALTQSLLSAAKRAGADAADAMAVQGTSVSIDVRAGALEHAERSEGIDIGLRVFVGQRLPMFPHPTRHHAPLMKWRSALLRWHKRHLMIPMQALLIHPN